MNKTHLPRIIAMMAVLAVAGCNKAGKLSEHSKQPLPTGPVELKLKWAAGERVVQDMDMKMKMETTIPGQPAPMQQNMTMGQKFALTVLKETPDGGHELEMEFLSARMGMEQGGKAMINYDSSKKSEADSKNPVAGMFDKIVGSKIKCVLDASNNVDHVEGVDEMMARLSTGRNAAAVAPLKSMYSEGYFKQILSSSRFMPPNAVSPGDSWPVKMEVPMDPLGTLVMDYTFTLTRWETHGARNCARMEFQGTMQTKTAPKANSTGMTMTIQNGTTSGVSWFDPELGITIDTQMNQDLTMNITVPKNPRVKQGPGSQPQNLTMSMNQVLNIKLDSVK